MVLALEVAFGAAFVLALVWRIFFATPYASPPADDDTPTNLQMADIEKQSDLYEYTIDRQRKRGMEQSRRAHSLTQQLREVRSANHLIDAFEYAMRPQSATPPSIQPARLTMIDPPERRSEPRDL